MESSSLRLVSPRSWALRLRGIVFVIPCGIILLLALLPTNAVQMLSLIVYPISPKMFRRINRECANAWWSLCVFWMKFILRVEVVQSGDVIPPRENAMVFANHQQMPDIPVLFPLAFRSGRLGDLKWFVKNVIRYIPGVGWGMLFLDCLFLKRDWLSDRKKVEATFEKLRRHQTPFWLVSFVEGTRITPKKLAKNQIYAKRKGLLPLMRVMVPRTKGFTASVMGLRDRLDAVYDVTIRYPDGIPTLGQFAAGYVRQVEVHVARFPVADLPTNEEDLADWLQKRFQIKDSHLANSWPAVS